MVVNFFDDKFNQNNKRNRNNTPNREYNCGGWALNIFSWYRPTTNPFFCKWGKVECYTDGDQKLSTTEMFNITLKSVDCMLHEFKDLRVISNLNELKSNEYAIAFRIGSLVNDFHFCKRSKNGHWTHKMGGSQIRPISKQEVFADNWFGEYCGHLVLFAKKI